MKCPQCSHVVGHSEGHILTCQNCNHQFENLGATYVANDDPKLVGKQLMNVNGVARKQKMLQRIVRRFLPVNVTKIKLREFSLKYR